MSYGIELVGPDGQHKILSDKPMLKYLGRFAGTYNPPAGDFKTYTYTTDVTSVLQPLVMLEVPQNSTNTPDLAGTVGASVVSIQNMGSDVWRVYIVTPWWGTAVPHIHAWSTIGGASSDTYGMRAYDATGGIIFDSSFMGLHVEAYGTVQYSGFTAGTFYNSYSSINWSYNDFVISAAAPSYVILLDMGNYVVNVFTIVHSFYEYSATVKYLQRFWVLTHTTDAARWNQYSASYAWSGNVTRDAVITRAALYV